MDQVKIDEVFLQTDRDEVDAIILRIAERILKRSGINKVLANPIAMEIVRSYLYYVFCSVCEREGIDVSNIPNLKNENLSLTVKTRH